jgi:hypothetical protein
VGLDPIRVGGGEVLNTHKTILLTVIPTSAVTIESL